MTRAIVVMCGFASARMGKSRKAARADLPQTGSTDTQFKQRDQRYRLRRPFTAII